MPGWHHQCNGHKLGPKLGGGEGQGSLTCCSPWGHKKIRHDWATTTAIRSKWYPKLVF